MRTFKTAALAAVAENGNRTPEPFEVEKFVDRKVPGGLMVAELEGALFVGRRVGISENVEKRLARNAEEFGLYGGRDGAPSWKTYGETETTPGEIWVRVR